jgi:outer membrane lipoprotein SlyB
MEIFVHKTIVSRALLVVCMGLSAAGCARQIGGDVVEGRSIGSAVRTERGVIESARYVTVQESETLQGNVTGGVIGGLAGGAAGSLIGGGFGRVVAIGAGAIAGAALGALTEQRLSNQNAIEYIVKLQNGELFSVVQGLDNPMDVGTPVLVQLDGRGRARVLPA